MVGAGESLGKTDQLLAYIIKNHDLVSITSLMKLSYIIDLVSVDESGTQISDFEYTRYNYGPFDQRIYGTIQTLEGNEIISEEIQYTSSGLEFIVYQCINENIEFNKLAESEINIIDRVLNMLSGYGPKALTELAYRTKPMLKIGAEIGNRNGLNQILDLKTK